MSGKIVVVNAFTFCSEHGNELCFVCNRDYRRTNNASAGIRSSLSQKLGRDFEIVYGFDLEERQPLNIYAFGVTKHTHHRGSRATGSCPDHTRLDCGKCFDWVRLIGSEATGDNFDGVRARVVRNNHHHYSPPSGMLGATV